MKRLLVHVEGQTEESFVRDVLQPHLAHLSVSARLLGNARARTHRGGIAAWDSVEREIARHLKQDKGVYCTTMIDLYGLPKSWPGRSNRDSGLQPDSAPAIQKGMRLRIANAIGTEQAQVRFIPYIVTHEFEGLLFSECTKLAQAAGDQFHEPKLRKIRNEFTSPEDINNGTDTHPSRRILNIIPHYQKRLHGVLAAKNIGIDSIRRQCPLFDQWLGELESIK